MGGRPVPIKTENLALYPPDWPTISWEAKQRAGWACEHPGCTARHYSVGYWTHTDAWLELAPPPYITPSFRGPAMLRQRAAEVQWSRFGDDPDSPKIIVIVLTVAHLDHDPTNCDPKNLRAWCQRHHLRYDAKHHAQTAYTTRMQKRGNLELPL